MNESILLSKTLMEGDSLISGSHLFHSSKLSGKKLVLYSCPYLPNNRLILKIVIRLIHVCDRFTIIDRHLVINYFIQHKETPTPSSRIERFPT